MQIAFKKIPINPVEFETQIDSVRFYGKVRKDSKNLALCEGKIEGILPHTCDRCGGEFEMSLDEDVKIFASDGIYEQSETLLDIIEFFDAQVDFDTILHSEIGSISSDYHHCEKCS